MEYPVLDVKATGRRICELRRANHLSVEDVSRFMGFQSTQAVYKWQRGESLPTVENLYALSKLFGTSVDAILCGKEEDETSSSFCFRFTFTNNRLLLKQNMVV
ncbi:MAG: helix-turn-helix domain-containing protein [Lachnospiraceae bacterium]|nr:helix-turn-helix domain-containing protein [Lachnospiraceae bacterium]